MKERKAMAEQFNLFQIERFKGKALFNVPMSRYTSLKIGGNADCMAFPKDETDLRDILSFAASKNFPVHLIGAGTNLLVRDGGIRGVVVNMSEGFSDINWTGEDICIAGSGLRLAELLSEASRRGLTGLEFACGIPGTIGGAVIMNAGAYGGEMKDVVEGIEILTAKLKKGFLSRAELKFSYRHSAVPQGAIILRAHMRFEKNTPDGVEGRMKEFRKKRETTMAIRFPNAGSIFKNPEGFSAGKLIDETGLKGKRIGDAAISEIHANYIVNTAHATARDVLSLMALMRDTVHRNTGIVLEPEIRVMGDD